MFWLGFIIGFVVACFLSACAGYYLLSIIYKWCDDYKSWEDDDEVEHWRRRGRKRYD